MINLSDLAFVSISNNNEVAKSVLEKIKRRIESNYQAEIIGENLERLV